MGVNRSGVAAIGAFSRCALTSRQIPLSEDAMQATAAVFRKVHEPLTIEPVDLDKPWGREVLVRTVATGVCHSDLHVVDGLGRFPLDRPFVLGHEGAGVVEAVGKDVTTMRVGDHVVACLSGFCGTCPQCLSGHPNVCTGGLVARAEDATPRVSQGGKPFRTFAAIGSYASHMLLHENSLVRIEPEIPLDRASLVGCGVLTGVGAALRTAGLQAGQTVAVFGCGGVGLSIVQGARIGGARQIIAVDQFDSKLEMAKGVGATHTVNSTQDDPVKAVRALSKGLGVDHAFEAVGIAKLCRQAIECLAVRGTATIVGVLPPEATIEFPWMAIRPECKVQTSRMGSNQFRSDIPNYLEFYRQGRLDLDSMISRRGHLDDINDAFRAMKAGEVARTVLMFD
jgi:S-(hydroxymethyl)glutathione dehydrogenase/alcohol dehydrogenase